MHVRNRQQGRTTAWCRACILTILIAAASALAGCGGGVSSTQVVPGNSASQTDPIPQTGSATLAWVQPSTNADGSPLTSLAGYKVYYGTSPGVYTSIVVGDITSYRIDGLVVGKTYYFTVTAYDASGNESDYSTVVSKLIS
jgi:hypothetical protein